MKDVIELAPPDEYQWNDDWLRIVAGTVSWPWNAPDEDETPPTGLLAKAVTLTHRPHTGHWEEEKHPRGEHGHFTHSAAHDALYQGSVVGEMHPLGRRGGMNRAYTVEVEHQGQRHQMLAKPVDEMDRYVPNQGGRAVGAYLVNAAMGHLIEMPEVAVRELGEHRLAEVQPFLPHQGTWETQHQTLSAQDREALDPQLHDIALFDVITGNVDRHGGNLLVRRGDDGTLHLAAIDHNQAFTDIRRGEGNGIGLYLHDDTTLPFAGQVLGHRHREAIQQLSDRWDDLVHHLKHQGIFDRQIENMGKRVIWLHQHGRLPHDEDVIP